MTQRSSFDLFGSGPNVAYLFPLSPFEFPFEKQHPLSGFVASFPPNISGLSLLGLVRYVGCRIYARPCQDYARAGRGRVAAWADICITAGRPSPLAPILIVTFPLSQVSHTTRISGRKEEGDEALEKVGLVAQGVPWCGRRCWHC